MSATATLVTDLIARKRQILKEELELASLLEAFANQWDRGYWVKFGQVFLSISTSI